ncbi:unnamed protein product [Auanema sp. JU1783]|nr:unnamed protein product [Auanema sp. JU1783]
MKYWRIMSLNHQQSLFRNLCLSIKQTKRRTRTVWQEEPDSPLSKKLPSSTFFSSQPFIKTYTQRTEIKFEGQSDIFG